jgi:hypothetical protein
MAVRRQCFNIKAVDITINYNLIGSETVFIKQVVAG